MVFEDWFGKLPRLGLAAERGAALVFRAGVLQVGSYYFSVSNSESDLDRLGVNEGRAAGLRDAADP